MHTISHSIVQVDSSVLLSAQAVPVQSNICLSACLALVPLLVVSSHAYLLSPLSYHVACALVISIYADQHSLSSLPDHPPIMDSVSCT